MSSEENYLDDLLNNVLVPKAAEPMEEAGIQDVETAGETQETGGFSLADNDAEDVRIDMNIEDIGIEDIDTEDVADNDTKDIKTEDMDLEDIYIEDIETEDTNTEDIGTENINAEDIALGDIEVEDIENAVEEPEAEALDIIDIEQVDVDKVDIEEANIEEAVAEVPETEEFPIEHSDVQILEEPLSDMQISEMGENLNLEGIEMPESEDDFKLEDIDIPVMPDGEPQQDDEMDIDGLEDAIQSETELEMAGALDSSDMDLSDFDMEDLDLSDLSDEELNELSMSDSDVSAEIPVSSGDTDDKDASINMDDNLEDVLNMLDDDAELAEINDMLKKSDNNEPIQDDMMNLLHQMADDEAASVNAGVKNVEEEDDGGVPLPEIPQSVLNVNQLEKTSGNEEDAKKKGKKAASKKKNDGDADTENKKESGKLGKFFNMLTEELVPEPTEAELAAEKAAKEAKKQENLTKKEEEKLAKEEAKKAKAEEQEAAKKAKQEAAAQKKKEKQAQKEAKAAAKKAKQEAEGSKKRIPPKKIAVGVVFGASVGGALLVATNILSTQGFLQTARNAYYDEDYKTVYQATFGMNLDDSKSDGLIKARSEVIYKVQRRYDSYQNNLKMGREVEALDALLQGITAYDTVNADAEKYDVLAEVEAIKTDILNVLQAKYNLDEAAARELINTEDALTYTVALNLVIAANQG